MARNGSGVFSRLYNWVNDRDAAIDITASRMDAEMDGMATALTESIARNGETTITANLPMATYKHTGVGASNSRTDYADTASVQDGSFNYAADGGAADAYTITPSPAITSYATGQEFAFKVTNANTGASTLNVNGVGAKTIKKYHDVDLEAGDFEVGGIYVVRYDGTNLQLVSPVSGTTLSRNLTLSGNNTFTGTNDFTAAPFLGASPIVFEGATADGFETTIAVTDPTADNTQTLPDKSGTFAMTSDLILKNFRAGLIISNSPVDADHDIDIAPGSARDTTDAETLTLGGGGLRKQLDASWVVGHQQGGLSSSLSISADTWYHVFLVKIGSNVDVIFDTSITCANGVTDHSVTYYRRVGSILTDSSSNILGFTQYGLHFQYDATIADLATSTSGTTAATRTLSTPLGVKTIAKIRAYQQKSTTTIGHLITSLDADDEAPSVTNASMYASNNVSGITGLEMQVMTNTSSQIRTRASADSCTLNIETFGWIDVALEEGT